MTVKHIRSRTSNQLSISLNKVYIIYPREYYNVEVLLTDMEFDLVASKIPHVTVNTAAVRENMGDTEREISVIKEHGKATPKTLPFRAVPKRVIIELVYLTAPWINDFPAKTGIYKVYSPHDIISVRQLYFKIHFRMEFGEYADVHDEPSLTNIMKSRTRKCLGIEPTGNIQGSYK